MNAKSRTTITTTRTVTVLGVDDKPALELTCLNGGVRIVLLPKQGARRAAVNVADLAEAVAKLA